MGCNLHTQRRHDGQKKPGASSVFFTRTDTQRVIRYGSFAFASIRAALISAQELGSTSLGEGKVKHAKDTLIGRHVAIGGLINKICRVFETYLLWIVTVCTFSVSCHPPTASSAFQTRGKPVLHTRGKQRGGHTTMEEARGKGGCAREEAESASADAKNLQIQTYMKMKNQLRNKEKKAAAVQAKVEMVARKEKMKALEMERRARLRLETLNGKERRETFSRPQWDSSPAASNDEVDGPWSNLSYPTATVDLPLPKRVDAVQSAWWHSESSQGNPNEGNNNHHKACLNKSHLYQEEFQESKLSTPVDQKVCSKHNVKVRSFSPVQCYKDGSKEMRLSLSVTRRSSNFRNQQQQHAESVLGDLKRSRGILEKPKYIPKYTLFQQAYDTDGSIPTSCYGDSKQRLSLQNKGKVSVYNTIDQSSIAVERGQKMPANKSMMMDDLYHRVNPPSTSSINQHMIDDVKSSLPCHTQYLTYHLENFPSREALSEKKRVALLKLLAQQLVSRLDAAEMHPSYLLDDNVQAHAVLLRSNLEKFHRELHAAVKALEGRYSYCPREKSSGYIVLPSKLERTGCSEATLIKQPKGPQAVGLDLMQIKDAFNKEAAFLYRDSSSETTASFTSVLFDSSSPQKAKKVEQYRVLHRESSKHKNLADSLVAYEESSKVLEPETQDNMCQDFESRSFPVDSMCKPTNQGKRTWDHQLLDKELEKLDAEIKETKSRMARNLFLTHPPLADTSSVTSPLSNSPRCSDNAASLLEGNGSVSATLVHATTEVVVLPSLNKETVRLQHVSDAPNEPKTCEFLDDKISRVSADSTLVAEICLVNEKDLKNDVKLKMQEGETVSANHLVDYCKIDVELPLHAATSSITSSTTSLETSLCIDTKRQSDSIMEASPTYPSVRKVEVSQVAREPNSAGGLTILFKKDMETNQKVLVDIITEALMQELLDYELSDMVLHGRSSPIKRMKDDFLESASISMDAPTLHPLSDISNSPCRSAFASLIPEISDICVTGSSNTYNDYQNCQSYYDFATEKCSSPVIGSPEVYREPFKITSKRLVDKYVKESLEAPGLLCSSSLLELYASGKTLSLVLGKQSLDGGEQEEQLYGKMILEAICDCLDKTYLRFCLPSFFLFLQPCPEGPYLKKTLISTVNEHADAACEGGFSLEYILEKSLDEEDWKTPYHEMMEVLHNISEYVMVDMIDNFLHDLMEVKHLACASQVAMGFMHSTKLEALHC